MCSMWVDFRHIAWKSELAVDHSAAEQMTINFDISFPKVPCFGIPYHMPVSSSQFIVALTLDVMDAADQHQNNLEKDVTKRRQGERKQDLGIYKGRRIFIKSYAHM